MKVQGANVYYHLQVVICREAKGERKGAGIAGQWCCSGVELIFCRSHCFSIEKGYGGIRLCVDYRALNAVTVKDRYPLLLISDLLAVKRYFTTLDMAQGYYQVPMQTGSVYKTAFITPDGQLRVPFGLANFTAV